MKIKIDFSKEAEITEWDEVDVIDVEIIDDNYDNSPFLFNFERPEDESRFYPQEEMTKLGTMLVKSEQRLTKLLLFITGSLQELRDEANEIVNTDLSS